MVVALRTYNSPTGMVEAVESEIVRTKSMLGEYLRRLEREVVLKSAGKKEKKENFKGLTIGNLDIVLDADSWNELTAVEEAVRSQQEKLLGLEKAREALKWVDQIGNIEGFKYLVLENNGIQKKILIGYAKESMNVPATT